MSPAQPSSFTAGQPLKGVAFDLRGQPQPAAKPDAPHASSQSFNVVFKSTLLGKQGLSSSDASPMASNTASSDAIASINGPNARAAAVRTVSPAMNSGP